MAWGVGVIDRLSVLCFAGTYALALVAELARFVVRSPVRWYLTVGLTALGWLVQTAYLANLALKDPMAPVADGVRVADGAVVDRGPDRAVPDGPLAQAGGRGDVRAAAGAGPGRRRGLVRAAGIRLARLGRHGRASGARCTGSSCWPARSSPAWRSPPG